MALFDLQFYSSCITSLIFLFIVGLIPLQSQNCYPQGPCDAGYMDITNGHSNYWACGVDCVGGKHRTNGGCGCACIPESTCTPTSATMPPTTSEPTPVTISPTTYAPTENTPSPTTSPTENTYAPTENTISPTTYAPTENTPSPTTTPVSALPVPIADEYGDDCFIAKQFSMQTPTKTTILTTGDVPIFDAPESNVPVTLTMIYNFSYFSYMPQCYIPFDFGAVLTFGVNDAPDTCVIVNDRYNDPYLTDVINGTVSVNYTSDGTQKRILAHVSENWRDPYDEELPCFYYSAHVQSDTANTLGYINGMDPTLDPTAAPITDPITANPTRNPTDRITEKPTKHPTNPITAKPTKNPIITIIAKHTIDPTPKPITKIPTVHSTMSRDEMNESIPSREIAHGQQLISQATTIIMAVLGSLLAMICCVSIAIIAIIRYLKQRHANSQFDESAISQPGEEKVVESDQPVNICELQPNAQFVGNKGEVCNASVVGLELSESESGSSEHLYEKAPTVERNATPGDTDAAHTANVNENQVTITAEGNVTRLAMINDKIVKGLRVTPRD